MSIPTVQEALRTAIYDDDVEKVENLIKNGADINFRYSDDSDRTPLYYAIRNGFDRHTVGLLYEVDVDDSVVQSGDLVSSAEDILYDEFILGYQCSSFYDDDWMDWFLSKKTIVDYFPFSKDDVFSFVEGLDICCLIKALQHHDISIREPLNERTLLHEALSNPGPFTDIISGYLVHEGADRNALDVNGETPYDLYKRQMRFNYTYSVSCRNQNV